MYYLLMLAMALCPCQGALAQRKDQVMVQALEIRKPMPAPYQEEPTYKWPGTSITLLVTLPDKYIVRFDKFESTVARFADDRNTDLTVGTQKKSGFRDRVTLWDSLSKDSRACSVTIDAPGNPASGAIKLMLKASLIIQCGSDEKTVEGKNTLIKEDGVKVGPLSVSQVKGINTGSGDEEMIVSIQSNQPSLKTAIFLDKEGKEIKATDAGSIYTRIGNSSQYNTHFTLDRKVDQVTVRITYFSKIENVVIPVDLQVGVGF